MQPTDPNQPTTSSSTPPIPSVPQQMPPAVTPPVMTQPIYPQPVQPVAASQSGGKKPVALIVSIILGVLLLVAGAVMAWIFLFSPMAQATKASNAFMTAASSGNLEELYTLSDANDDEAAKQFLKSSAENVSGSYNLSEKVLENDKGYFLYELTNDTNKFARTIVEKKDGKWVVTSFVYSPTALNLKPGSSEETTQDTQEVTPDTSVPAASSSLACLAQDDYKWLNYDKQPSSVTYDDYYEEGKTYNKTEYMFFSPDTTNETSFLSIYDDWAEFATKTADKQWKFRLSGSTYGSDSGTSASKALANQRAEKVKSQLTQRSVPADRIIIEEPHDYSSEEQDAMNEIYRRVEVLVDPTCNQ